MTFDLYQVSLLLSGRLNPVWICSIPAHARELLGCSTGAVYLSRASALHILEGHNDIDDFTLLRLPIIINQGVLYRESDRRFVNAVLSDRDGINFFVAMKIAANGHELWVSSMYRIAHKRLVRKLRKMKPLK